MLEWKVQRVTHARVWKVNVARRSKTNKNASIKMRESRLREACGVIYNKWKGNLCEKNEIMD